MKRILISICLFSLSACGGNALDVPEPSPDLAPAPSPIVAPDAAIVDALPVPAIDTQPVNPCGQGYAPAEYSPTTFIWCAPTGDPISGRPCGSMVETALFGEGIYRCVPST
jgi:hypothetical protein